jgi:hypothetical protein
MAHTTQLSGHSDSTSSASAALTVTRVLDALLIALVVIGLVPAVIIGALGFVLPPLATLLIGLGVALIVTPVGARLGRSVYRSSSDGARPWFTRPVLQPKVRRVLLGYFGLLFRLDHSRLDNGQVLG